MNSYIPYVGVQVENGDSLVFRVIGFPWVPGSLKWDEVQVFGGPTAAAARATTFNYKSGQFIEVFLSYSKKVAKSMEFGAFATYNGLSVSTAAPHLR